MTEQIRTEISGGVAVVTLNKPARRNALGTESMAGLRAALVRLSADPACRAVVLTGAPPAFCSGSDLKELGALSVPGMCAHEAETAMVARQIGLSPLPVVAAVEGFALGGGMILALSCDVVVTARGTRWNLPEVQNGWLPPWGLQALLARDGNIRFVVKEFPVLGEESVLAARFAVASLQEVGPDAYAAVHEALITLRGPVNEPALRDIATAAGFDAGPVLAAMQGPAVTQVLADTHALARRMGIEGTPAFALPGQMVRGLVPLDEMERLVALERAR